MKFKRFQCMFWRNTIYLLPTIVINDHDYMYYGRNFTIEFHFLFWHMRWLWLESED